MASRLEDRLLLGEQVVYRVRHDLTSAAVFIGAFLAVLSLAFLAVEMAFSFGPSWQTWIIYVLVFSGYWAWRICNRTVLVTDRRVLYAHGEWKRKVTEFPFEMIEEVILTPGIGAWGGFVTISCRSGERTNLGLVPSPQDLRDAIAQQCGLP